MLNLYMLILYMLILCIVSCCNKFQTAIDAPRFCILDGTQNGIVYLEEGFHPKTIAKLKSMGHHIRANVSGHEREVFGRAQIIVKDTYTGVLCAGSDGRADGCALGY
jgi:gamma-glutamyltranspeptidase/glutathione hydrolase